MLYVLTGSDTIKAKARAMQLAKGFELVRFGDGGEPFANVMGYLSAQGLFAPKVALLLDRPLDDGDGKLLLTEHSAELAKGDALVLVIEPALSAPVLKSIGKAATVENFDEKEKKEMPASNVFALTDAFARGDRKTAWILYRKLIDTGSAPEEIHGALTWQARALVLASRTKNAEEAGLKSFVYGKAKRAGARLGEQGTVALSRELVALIHKSRSGDGNLGDLLEAFLLKK
jgi:DNA polymerase III delta subunit